MNKYTHLYVYAACLAMLVIMFVLWPQKWLEVKDGRVYKCYYHACTQMVNPSVTYRSTYKLNEGYWYTFHVYTGGRTCEVRKNGNQIGYNSFCNGSDAGAVETMYLIQRSPDLLTFSE